MELLSKQPGIRQRYQDYFRYILVDEFQDTSPVQMELIRLLARSEPCAAPCDSAESEDEKERRKPCRDPAEIEDRTPHRMGKREKRRRRVARDEYRPTRGPHACTTAQRLSSAASIARASSSPRWS